MDSHLAAVMTGIAGTTVAISFAFRTEVVAWYVAAAAAVYLFVASRWEASRAVELEEQYAPIPPRVLRVTPRAVPQDSLTNNAAEEADSRGYGEHEDLDDAIAAFSEFERRQESLDVDEILRKLHREGADSLTPVEQQMLLSASRELQQKRGKQ